MALAALVLGVTMGAVGGASSASAADLGIALSTDGVHWSSRLNANVFDTSKPLVPGDTVSGSFYVKNVRDSPAWLRVGLSSVTVTNWSLAQAIDVTTVGTTTGDSSGTTESFAGPDAVCSDLLRRDAPIPAGGIVHVTTDLLFRATTAGTEGQGQLAKIGFIVELSDLDLNATSTPLCTGSLQVGPVDSGDDSSGEAGGAEGPDIAGDGATESGGGSAPSIPSVAGAGGTISYGTAVHGLVAPANTMRLYEEYAIFILLGAALAGILLRLVARWRLERANGPTTEGNP